MNIPNCQVVGEYLELERKLIALVERNPDYYRGLVHLGRIYWLEGHCLEAVLQWKLAWEHKVPEAAFELFLTGVDVPVSAEIRAKFSYFAYLGGRAAQQQSQRDAAQYWYERSFAFAPDRKLAVGPLAGLYVEQRDPEKAIALWVAHSETLPQSVADYWWAQAKIRELREDWGSAAQAYMEGVALSSEPFDFFMGAGWAWERAGQWEKSEILYELARQEKPGDARPYRRLGDIYFRSAQYLKARNAYTQGLALDPNNYIFHHALGRTYFALGNLEEAKQYYIRALALKPDHAPTAYYLAQVYYVESDYGLAEAWLAKALDMNPQAPDAWWFQLVDWYLERGDCSAATEALKAAAQAGIDERTLHGRFEQVAVACQSQ